jgi:hypothetical protein
MMPMPVPPPPVQQARWIAAPTRQRTDTATVRKELRPLPPPASRISQTFVVTDRWGHLTGLGNETDRQQVQAPTGAMDFATPIMCGLLGYIVVGALTR